MADPVFCKLYLEGDRESLFKNDYCELRDRQRRKGQRMNEPVLTSDDPFEGMTRNPHPVEALHHIKTLARSAQDITDMDTAQKNTLKRS